jgi:predicted nucleotidyltransferase
MAVLWGVSHSISIGSEMEQCQTQKNGLRLNDSCHEIRKLLTLFTSKNSILLSALRKCKLVHEYPNFKIKNVHFFLWYRN